MIRQRVNNARMVQLHRFQKRNIHANAHMGARDIKRYCPVNDDGERLVETAINQLGLSARAYSRVLKVGRTIADLAGSEQSNPPTSPKRFSIEVWIADSKAVNQRTASDGAVFSIKGNLSLFFACHAGFIR